jgi:hypothetical protein
MQLRKKLRLRDKRRHFQCFFTFFQENVKARSHSGRPHGPPLRAAPTITLNPPKCPVKKILVVRRIFFAAEPKNEAGGAGF